MIIRREIKGDPIRLNHLPWPELASRFERWQAHVLENEKGLIGLDVETTAIDQVLSAFNPDASLRLVQFGSINEAWSLDPDDEFWRDRIECLLSDERFRFVSHTNYDPLWINREFGVWLGDQWIDTMPLACLVRPGHTPKDLKSLSADYIDPALIEAEQELHAHIADLYYARTVKLPKSFEAGKSACRVAGCEARSWKDSLCGRCYEHYITRKPNKEVLAWGFTNIALDDEIFGTYAGLDAVVVRRLCDILGAQVAKAKMSKLSRREQRINRATTASRIRGLLVDQEWTDKVVNEINDEYVSAQELISDVIGCRPLSPKVGDWLLDRGVKFTEATESGLPKLTMPSATSPGTLPDLLDRYGADPEVGPVIVARHTIGTHRNILANIEIIREQARADGYAHPQVNTMAAHTGRMSIVKPAMQTFKKNDPRLRGCFIARPGYVLVGADYKSQEIRIGAAFSRDPALLKIVAEDLNQHELTADLIFGRGPDHREPPWPGARSNYDKAKTLDFGLQYGIGPKKLAKQLDISYGEASALWAAWKRAYSGLVEWTDKIGQAKIIVNPWGRRIPADPWRPYASGNYAIQSTGRDVLGQAIERLIDAGWEDALWLPIHDELVLEVHSDEAEHAVAALEELMPTTIRGIELPVDAKIIGNRWGAKD